MTPRRAWLAGLALAPGLARAQGRPPPIRIGFLHPRTSPILEPLRIAAMRAGLAEAARSNRPVEVIPRIADGTPEQLLTFAQELAALRLDAIVAVAPAGVAAARGATRTTPIVAVDLETDPVAAGWVGSLGRPGGNVTGMFFDIADFAAKCLQILAEAVRPLPRVGVLWDPSTGGYQRAAAEPAAAAMGIALDLRSADRLAAIPGAVEAMTAAGARALLCLSSPLFAANTGAIAEMVARAGLPTIMLFPEFARNGGLMAYGPDLQDIFRRAGAMARRIADGARTAELPVERPVRFNLVINLPAALALGLDLPPMLLARADEVVE